MDNGLKAIIDGLNYHFENFKLLNEKIDPWDSQFNKQPDHYKNRITITNMQHEMTAYLNRMGQFYYFATSNKISKIVQDSHNLIPTIIRFIPFRHKQTAHRAIDVPRKEDNIKNMEQLDRLFSDQYMLINNNLVFQILIDEKDYRHLELLNEHPKIIKEIENFINLTEK